MSLAEAEENLAWRIGTDEMIAIELKDSRKMIGNVYLGKREFGALEIGYVFNRAYWLSLRQSPSRRYFRLEQLQPRVRDELVSRWTRSGFTGSTGCWRRTPWPACRM